MKRQLILLGAAICVMTAAASMSAFGQTNRALQDKQLQEDVDTAKFKKAPPYKIGVSAGYLSNSWVVFCLQHIRYEASLHPEITDIIVTDAAFNPTKQVADIEDLISKNVSLILYWPVDDKAIESVLKKAVDKGIATIDTGGGFVYSPGTTSSAFIDQLALGEMVAKHLAEDLKGKGKIFAMLPIAGTTAAVDQLAALKDVLKSYPQIELLTAEHGDWNRAKAKQITENLLQRYPHIDGVFSPAGQMSIGVAEAFEEAGRLNEVTMSPGDEYNGWLKWVAKHHQGGAVTFPTRAGKVGLQVGLEALAGHTIKRGNVVPSEYIAPADIGRYLEASAPDDWWASNLPTEWKPK
jgi:ABC-type sugar transport system substrate-binding protein